MPTPTEIYANWNGIIDKDFCSLILQVFNLQNDDSYIYRAESFAMTLQQIQQYMERSMPKYKYSIHGSQVEVPSADITAYTSIFSPTTDTYKALTAFTSNAKKYSPRETVAKYLISQRIDLKIKIPKSKSHVNPYFDLWAYLCQLTSFLGPLPDPSYSNPRNSRRTHPILPVLYHHFGCVVPSYEALYIISDLAAQSGVQGIVDMGSGNGYWTFLLRQMKSHVVAVDNFTSQYRTMWISDTTEADGIDYLRQNDGARGYILLIVYAIAAGAFTQQLLQAYKGNTIAIVGTQNANRYTTFSDCTTEEYFKKEMPGWTLASRIPLPSFPGKDEAMFVWQKNE